MRKLTYAVLRAIGEKITESVVKGEDRVTCRVDLEDGYIDITSFKSGTVCVLANHHDIRRRHNLDRLEEFVEGIVKKALWGRNNA